MKNKENKIACQCNNNALNKFNESRIILSDSSTVGEFIETLERFPKNAILSNPRQDIFDVDDNPTTVGEIISDLKSLPSQCIISNTDPYTMSVSEPVESKCNCSNCTCEDEDDEELTSIITETGNNLLDDIYGDLYKSDRYRDANMQQYLKDQHDVAEDLENAYVAIQNAGSMVKEELDKFAIEEKAKIDAFVSQQKSLVDEEVARQQFRFLCEDKIADNMCIMCTIRDCIK